MASKKGIVLFICFVLLIIGVLFYKEELASEDNILIKNDTNTIRIWYSDEAIGDYLNSAAVSYLEEYGVRVVPELHDGLEYIEAVDEASKNEDMIPDLFITGTDSIEKAAMAGIAIPVSDKEDILNETYYPTVALDAVTYHNQKFGYPFYYETAFMLYNQTYLNEVADAALRNELLTGVSENAALSDGDDEGMEEMPSISENEAPPEGYSEAEWAGRVVEKANTMIPDSVADILAFANTYSTPDQVENIFLWDVSDIFYNYFITGAYMNAGGPYGDDSSVIELSNEDSITCMQVYQGLNQFFSIDATTSNYEDVISDFINGKTIFTIATTDSIALLEQAIHEGTFTWQYSVAPLPGVDDSHIAKGLSSTKSVFVNGYTNNREDAEGFARYITLDYSDSFFQRTGKMTAAHMNEDEKTKELAVVCDMYENSVPLPKLLGINNYWIEVELAYINIWEGADVTQTLNSLQEKMKKQLN